MKTNWKTIPAALLLGALLTLLPAAPVPAQEPADDGHETQAVQVVKVDKDGNVVENHKIGQDLQVHRVVLSQEGEDGLRVVRIPVEGTGDQRVKVVVRAGEDGEIQTVDVHGDEMEGMEKLGEHARAFFVPSVPRGFLGVQLTDLTSDLRAHFGAGEDRGVLVARVIPDSPAARAGLRVGDVLTHVDGQAVGSSSELTTRIAQRKEGELVALEVIRNGRVETLSATLEVRKRPQVEVGQILRALEKSGEALDFQFDREAFEQEMERVRAYFGSEEWQQEMEEMKVELKRELEDMEVELERLEESLHEQGEDLQRLHGEEPHTEPDP